MVGKLLLAFRIKPRELEKAGQKNPEYHTNAFILQTIVYNNEVKEFQNPTIYSENPAIKNEKLDLSKKKLEIETFNPVIAKQNYFFSTKENLLKVYNSVKTNQVFGAPEVKEILGCTVTA